MTCTCGGRRYQTVDQFAMESAVLPAVVAEENQAALNCPDHQVRARRDRRVALRRERHPGG